MKPSSDRSQAERTSGQILQLPPRFAQRIDTEQMRSLSKKMHAVDLADYLNNRMIELESLIDAVAHDLETASTAQMNSHARRISEIAGVFGFPDLSQAAGNVEHTLRGVDSAAIAATATRLVHLGRGALREAAVIQAPYG